MSKYKFNNAERFIVWKTYDCKCFWCGEPIEHMNTTVDHVFSESLLDDTAELERVKLFYSLPDDFEINDFCNWVPSHGNCNSKKSKKLFKKSPAFVMVVEQIAKKAVVAKKAYYKLLSQNSKDKVIMKILADLDNDTISDEDLFTLLETTSKYYFNIPKLDQDELLHVPDGWKIVSIDRKHGRIRVINGDGSGYVPIGEKPDSTWLCPICKNYGPWDGVKCTMCGHFIDPMD